MMTTFLSASLAAGALILLTALVRRFAGSRLPRRMYVALWDLAVIRLLVPIGLPRSGGTIAAYTLQTARESSLQTETVTADMVYTQAIPGEADSAYLRPHLRRRGWTVCRDGGSGGFMIYS